MLKTNLSLKKILTFTKFFSKNVLILGSIAFLLIAVLYFKADLLKRGADFVSADDYGIDTPSEQYQVDETTPDYANVSDQYPAESDYPTPTSQDYGIGTPSSQYQVDYGIGTPSEQYPVEPQPYVLQEIRECNGNNVVINQYWSNNTKKEVQNLGQNPGECGVPYSSSGSSLNEVPPSSNTGGVSSSQAYVLQEIRECDGNDVIINRYWSDGRKEIVNRIGRSVGECGVPYNTGSSSLNNVPATPTSGGSSSSQAFVLQDLRECDGNNVVINRYWSDGRKETVQRIGRNPGECGVPINTGSSSLSSVPATPVNGGSSSSQPFVLQDLRECDGNTVVINRYWSDGRKETIQRIGRNPGECGVPFNNNSASLSTVPATPSNSGATTSQPSVLQEIRECDGNTVVINRYWSNGRKETIQRIGQNPGECGVPFNTGSTSLSSVPATATSTSGTTATQPFVLQEIRECDGNTVVINRYWSNGRRDTIQRVGQNPGECGVPYPTIGSAAVAGAATTATSVVTTAAGGTSAYVLQDLRECNGNSVVINRYWSDGRREAVTNYGPQPGECGVAPGTNPAPTTSTLGTTTTTPTQQGNCPAGYSAQTINNTAYCVVSGTQSSPTSTSSEVLQPKVISQANADVTELPKTGLPLAAWGITGLLPLGMKLRRLKKGSGAISVDDDFSTTGSSANSIWLKREMKKD